ncbi:hypothetical protein BDV95DRAFT_600019 [Massariosphaeria phaeospora]|uniref:Rhodopsin domain-containing protein n=1 Tax=Massariosphaeria phaeospora TaxID=100035 RepID=A0A7C8HYK6_9PLEO|nr:hypothetical protein BDV95DRAFT_600019 [Massariosphaeria phaeospora]
MSDLQDLVLLGDAASSIRKKTFLIVTSIFFALAILSILTWTVLGYRHGHCFRKSDCIPILGTLCFIAGSAVMYSMLSSIYIGPAISSNAILASPPIGLDLASVTAKVVNYFDAFQCLIWTVIFSMKTALLLTLKDGAHEERQFRRVFVVVLMFIGTSWAFVFVTPFIVCPHLGGNAVQCFDPEKEQLHRTLVYVSSAIDCITYVLVLTVPMLLFRRIQLAVRQRVALATFLFFSVALILIAILRAIKPEVAQPQRRDVPLYTFLLHIEASVLFILFSVIAHPRLFDAHPPIAPQQWVPDSWTRRRNQEPEDEEESRETLTGLHTFVRRGSTPHSGLNRKESVLRTREVVVEISYEKAPDGDLWVPSPTWMKDRSGRSLEDSSDKRSSKSNGRSSSRCSLRGT